MANEDTQKRIEQAEYRTKLIESELNAVRQSKAYKVAKNIGIIKAQIKSDPVGLTKKAARVFLNEPSKFTHLFRTTSRGAFIAQSVIDQNAKYQEWILLNEPDDMELDKQRAQSDKLKYTPMISIITPVFNPPVDVLEELIESVLEQTYLNFELCLGDFGNDEAVEELLEKYAKLDLRIKYYKFTKNEGIAGNSNQILEKVNGEFIALLDHDDTLSPDALYENVKLLNEKPYDFIYSDKDKIDEKGNRFDPLFKPQLSPEMLLNINYLTHLNIMRTSIVKKIGGWDSETDGAQDWDLFLRVIEASKYVTHIPKVLYHWRVIATSTAMSINTKPYALAGQRKAVDKYLKSQKIPATSYHQRTELFLKWDGKVLDQKPYVFIEFSSVPNTTRVIRSIKKAVDAPRVIILTETSLAAQAKKLSDDRFTILSYDRDNFAPTLGKYIKSLSGSSNDNTVLFIRDSLKLTKRTVWYEDLTGWLSIDKVAAASGRIIDKKELIIDSSGLITPQKQYYPLFNRYPRYYQSYLGNAEWVRNLSVLSPTFCATKLSTLKEHAFESTGDRESAFDSYFMRLSKEHRLVMTPHATAISYDTNDIDTPRALNIHKDVLEVCDKFSNPNLSPADPLRLFEEEALVGINDDKTPKHEALDQYRHDAIILADTFDITAKEIEENRKIVENFQLLKNPQSVAWFLPSFDAIYAGLMNIFSFANYLATEQKLNTTIYILKNSNVDSERELVTNAFPSLKNAAFVAITPDQVGKIKTHDIGIATQWATTFPLAKVTNIKRKCYFIQDNEANFYPKGSVSALVELSYKFGFMAIANTEGLLDLYTKQYGGRGVVAKSLVDLSAYHPRKDVHYIPKKPYKVFFYARPNMPRNAFELGIAGLKRLKQDLGQDVEIITAGAPWDAGTYGVEGLFTNLGKIAYEAVPKLYRSVDAGLMFMFSGHPGVTASELMASGCPVVVNEYDDVTWRELYQHEKTCLITRPTASEVARNLKRCLEEPNLRKMLINNGIDKTGSFYSKYHESQKNAAEAIIGK